MKNSDRTVVVLGASDKPHRYSYKAITMLLEGGFRVIPVHPKLTHILGLDVVHSLSEVKGPVETVTLYIGPERSQELIPDIVKLKPARLIANPGTEDPDLFTALEQHDIEIVKGCTLVMLRTGIF